MSFEDIRKTVCLKGDRQEQEEYWVREDMEDEEKLLREVGQGLEDDEI
jgi:hypothetical protein